MCLKSVFDEIKAEDRPKFTKFFGDFFEDFSKLLKLRLEKSFKKAITTPTTMMRSKTFVITVEINENNVNASASTSGVGISGVTAASTGALTNNPCMYFDFVQIYLFFLYLYFYFDLYLYLCCFFRKAVKGEH